MPRDIEQGKPPDRRRGGYTTAASWLASDIDNETFTFRKFDRLSALNLLYLQSEVLEIEERIEQLHQEAMEGKDDDVRYALRRWETLVENAENGEDSTKERAKNIISLIRELRAKLREYHKALLLQSKIAQLKTPEERVLRAMRDFFEKPHEPVLLGKAKTFLKEKDDLVALKTPTEDALSKLLRKYLVEERESAGDGSYYGRFRESTVELIINVVTVVAAAILLFGPIIGLYFTNDAALKLGLIASFTTIFAASFASITNTSRDGVFGATAAYAAVLVVFVSNNTLSPS